MSKCKNCGFDEEVEDLEKFEASAEKKPDFGFAQNWDNVEEQYRYEGYPVIIVRNYYDDPLNPNDKKDFYNAYTKLPDAERGKPLGPETEEADFCGKITLHNDDGTVGIDTNHSWNDKTPLAEKKRDARSQIEEVINDYLSSRLRTNKLE